MHRNSPILLTLAALVGSAASDAVAAPTTQELQFFESKVRPLLSERCYRCHSTQAEKLKAGLFLDHGTSVLEGGESGPAVVPGEPDKSLLIESVRYKNPDLQMPPKKRLSLPEIKVLEDWVSMGAPWPDEPVPTGEKKLGPKNFDLAARKAEHWCWQPVSDPQPPEVANGPWAAAPIDRFILAGLEGKGIEPSPPADRRALIRRAYFDLIGLPPSPKQVEAFVADPSPDAFANVVDGLLASPHFGERWARHWMDLVRYAETCGHEFDYPIPFATEYRDYLIRAFNGDVPYNLFVKEHVAGDLLETPRMNEEGQFNESVIGTGFWHLHEATHAPTDVRGDEAGRVDNQIDVFSKTFLGVTVACARCHDHMFDAISTKDYYALAGYLQSSRRQEAMLDPGGKIADAVAELSAIKTEADSALARTFGNGVEPETLARYLMAAREVIRGEESTAVATRYSVKAAALERWVTALRDPEVSDPEHPLFVWFQFLEGEKEPPSAAFEQRLGEVHRRLVDQMRRHEESAAKAVKFADFSEGDYEQSGWFVTGEAFGDSPTAVAEWAHADASVAVPGRAHGGRHSGKLYGVLRSPTFEISHNQIHHRAVAHKGGLQVRLIIDSYAMEPYNGLLFRSTRINDPNTDGHNNWLSQGGDLKMYKGHKAHLEYIDHGDGFFEVDEIWFSDGGPPALAPSSVALKIAANKKIQSIKDLAMAYGWLWKHAQSAVDANLDEDARTFLAWAVAAGVGDDSIDRVVQDSQQKMTPLANSLPAPRRVQGLTDGTAENEKVFLRGSHKRLGDVVPRRFLTALGGESVPAPERGSGRLALAEQVVSPSNPLTSRVIVNRLWYHLFGRGIVPTTDDFGVLGQLPSHPELLDHLAASFMTDGWSIKRMLKRIMLSNTYQQASTAGLRADAVDPQNIFLHRANLRRLQGEVIRDSMLSISGRLDRKMFGGSVAVHVTDFMTGRGRPRSGPLDGAGRRSLYTAVRRNFLPPMMLAFDTPIPFSTMGRRSVSNVPAQALILMNDPFVHEQASLWAKRLSALKLETPELVHHMYVEAFARPPRADELAAGFDFLGSSPDEKTLGEYAHVLFNTKEFIFLH